MFPRSISLSFIALSLHGAALAQGPRTDDVSWTASAPASDVRPGSQVKVTLQGAVTEGWHVYGLEQLPGGPIPLLVKLGASTAASADGAPTASPTIKYHDPAFDLETQYYAKPFTLTVPVRVASGLSAGPQQIPVSVRFQTCTGQTCRPPRTVNLSATINVKAE